MTNDGLRAQNTAPPGTRPGVLQDPGPPLAAVTVGYVAAWAPSLVVAPVAAHDGLDDATVQFLSAQTLLAKQQEDEEARQAEELREWEDKFAKSETRIVEEVDRLRRLGDPSELTTLLNRVSGWYVNRNEVLQRQEKRQEEEEEAVHEEDTLALLFMMSLAMLSSVPLFLAVTCSSPEEYSTCLFWEKSSRNAVFSASWFDRGYMLLTSLRWLFLYLVTRILRLILVLLSVARVWRVPLVPGSHQFGVCREEYMKIGFLVLLVMTHFALCSLLLFSAQMLGIMAGMNQQEQFVAPSRELRMFRSCSSSLVVNFSVVVQRPIPMVLTVQADHSNSPVQFFDKVIDGPVVQGVQVVLLPGCGGDSTGAVLEQGDMPVVERQVSWSGKCRKLRNPTGAVLGRFRPDSAETRDDSTVAVLGQGCGHACCYGVQTCRKL